MTNPFAPAAAAAAQANPFGAPAAAPAAQANPFGGAAPAAAPAPVETAPPAAAPAAAGPVAHDPFATPPEAPALDGIDEDDVKANTAVILRFNKIETVRSSYKDESGDLPMRDRIHFDCTIVDGAKAGKHYTDVFKFWERFVEQFRPCVGDGKLYLVRLKKDGRANTTEPVTDPATRAAAAKLIGA